MKTKLSEVLVLQEANLLVYIFRPRWLIWGLLALQLPDFPSIVLAISDFVYMCGGVWVCAHFKSHKLKQIHFGQNVSQQRPFDSSYGRMNEWTSEHTCWGGEKEVHVRHPCWHHATNCGSVLFCFFFWVERCETVFRIMKIIMIIIIMMMIPRKKPTANVPLLPHTQTPPNTGNLSPQHWTEECWRLRVYWFRVLAPALSGPPGVQSPHPSNKQLMPQWFSIHFSPRPICPGKLLTSLFLPGAFIVTPLLCNIGINATK